MAKLVSKVYGDALFETAMEKELVDTLYEETSALLPILQANPELFSVLGNPQIVKEEKVALLHQVFSGKIAEELMGFLSIIVVCPDKQRSHPGTQWSRSRRRKPDAPVPWSPALHLQF